MNYKEKEFAIKYDSFEQAQQIRNLAESMGWEYCEEFSRFTKGDSQRLNCLFFTTKGDFSIGGKPGTPMFSLSNPGNAKCYSPDTNSFKEITDALTLENEYNDEYYFHAVNKELIRLGAFGNCYDKTYNPVTMILVKDSYANSTIFINSGKVQDKIKIVAYFKGDNHYPLQLQLYTSCHWKDVYDILSNIKSL